MIRKRINYIDKRIFGTLYRARRPLTIRGISRRTGLSWTTAKNHVNKLLNFGVVNNKRTIRRSNVSLKPKYWRRRY